MYTEEFIRNRMMFMVDYYGNRGSDSHIFDGPVE